MCISQINTEEIQPLYQGNHSNAHDKQITYEKKHYSRKLKKSKAGKNVRVKILQLLIIIESPERKSPRPAE